MKKLLLAAALAALLAGCQAEGSATKPAAVAMTDDALGHYCQMYVADHAGPKAQIHLAGQDQPLWFSQVSDAVAYLHDPEREAEVRAVYVSDMEKAASWGDPGTQNWIDGDAAYYVTGSGQLGGMGTPEAIPFGTKEAADAFAARKGGAVVRLADIPESYVRPDMTQTGDAAAGHAAMAPGTGG